MMKKLLSCMLAALLALPAATFAACTPKDTSESPAPSAPQEAPQTPETDKDPETGETEEAGVVIGSPIEIPAEKEREIVQAWLAAYPSDYVTANELSPDVRGVFGDTYVFYMHGPFGASDVITNELIGNVLFEYPSSLTLDVYCKGTFYSLSEAYKNRLLTRDNLLTLQKNYNNGWHWSMSQTIKEDYVREHDGVKTEELSLRVYYLCGIGMQCAALCVDGDWDYATDLTQQEADGVLFRYSSERQLLFYGDYDETDGMFCSLKTAIENGALNHNDLYTILYNYKNGIQIAIP